MPIWPDCGHDNSEWAKFCEECGAPVAEAEAAAVQEERKVVSVPSAPFARACASWRRSRS